MILILLRDGSYVEIPRGSDIVHRSSSLVCIDGLDAPLASFLADDVLAYTLNRDVARRLQREANVSPGDWLAAEIDANNRGSLKAGHRTDACPEDEEPVAQGV